jgi:hypothetical protein
MIRSTKEMATLRAPSSNDLAAADRSGTRFSLSFLIVVLAIYASAVFSVNNLLLDVAREGWSKIQLIPGTFAPAGDAQRLYQSASQTKAMSSDGELPDLILDGKVRPFDTRIIQQATQERQLRGPETFTK